MLNCYILESAKEVIFSHIKVCVCMYVWSRLSSHVPHGPLSHNVPLPPIPPNYSAAHDQWVQHSHPWPLTCHPELKYSPLPWLLHWSVLYVCVLTGYCLCVRTCVCVCVCVFTCLCDLTSVIFLQNNAHSRTWMSLSCVFALTFLLHKLFSFGLKGALFCLSHFRSWIPHFCLHLTGSWLLILAV